MRYFIVTGIVKNTHPVTAFHVGLSCESYPSEQFLMKALHPNGIIILNIIELSHAVYCSFLGREV